MNTDLRASLIASGAAALLSALIGAVAGVSFLALLLRALAGGLLFGGLVYAGCAVARRFMPELFGEAEEAPLDSGLGSSVNIVLPAEEPELSSGLADLGAEGPEADSLEPLPAAEEGPPAAPTPPAAAQPSRPARKQAVQTFDEDEADYSGASLLEGAEEAAEPESIASPQLAELPLREGLEDLDVLPDLETLTDSFSGSPSSSAAEEEEEESRPSYSPQSERGRGEGARGADPALLAQAVRTLLKKDQKG